LGCQCLKQGVGVNAFCIFMRSLDIFIPGFGVLKDLVTPIPAVQFHGKVSDKLKSDTASIKHVELQA